MKITAGTTWVLNGEQVTVLWHHGLKVVVVNNEGTRTIVGLKKFLRHATEF
jgi:hypothetical protein